HARVKRRDSRPLAGRGAEEELVVVAAAECVANPRAGRRDGAEPGGQRQLAALDVGADPARGAELAEVAREAVRNVDARGCDAAECEAERHPRLRQLEAREQRVAGATLGRKPALEDSESRRGVTRRTADP